MQTDRDIDKERQRLRERGAQRETETKRWGMTERNKRSQR